MIVSLFIIGRLEFTSTEESWCSAALANPIGPGGGAGCGRCGA